MASEFLEARFTQKGKPDWKAAARKIDKLPNDELYEESADAEEFYNELLAEIDADAAAYVGRDEQWLAAVRKLLRADLKRFREVLESGEGPPVISRGQGSRPSVERSGKQWVVRGLEHPTNADDYANPYWTYGRLQLANLLDELGLT